MWAHDSLYKFVCRLSISENMYACVCVWVCGWWQSLKKEVHRGYTGRCNVDEQLRRQWTTAIGDVGDVGEAVNVSAWVIAHCWPESHGTHEWESLTNGSKVSAFYTTIYVFSGWRWRHTDEMLMTSGIEGDRPAVVSVNGERRTDANAPAAWDELCGGWPHHKGCTPPSSASASASSSLS